MASASPPLPPEPHLSSPTLGEDWPAQAADTIERLVGNVRDKTTGPALTASRAVVYGTFAALIGAVILVLAIVGIVRLINGYLPGDVWATYLLLGGVFLLVGIILWSRRTTQVPPPTGR